MTAAHCFRPDSTKVLIMFTNDVEETVTNLDDVKCHKGFVRKKYESVNNICVVKLKVPEEIKPVPLIHKRKERSKKEMKEWFCHT